MKFAATVAMLALALTIAAPLAQNLVLGMCGNRPTNADKSCLVDGDTL